MYEIEKAMLLQPELLGRDWQGEVSLVLGRAIRKIDRVTFIGTGSSYHCALWAHWLALAAGRGAFETKAMTTWDFLMQSELAEARSKKSARSIRELYVVISHRGNRGLTEKALRLLASQPHLLVAAKGAPAGKHPILQASAPETSNAHTMSLVGAMAAVSELIAFLVSPHNTAEAKKLRKERFRTAELFADLLAVVDELGEGARFIDRPSRPALHILGGGPFHAIALELALKSQEIAHLAATGYNTEQFLHGPVAGVEETDIVIPLVPFSEPSRPLTRYLSRQRLEKCRKAGDAVGTLVITPSWGRSLKSPVAREASKLQGAWQALLPLLWGQALFVSFAKRHGFNPDTNRREDPRYDAALSVI